MTREEAIARIKDHMIVHKMHEPRAVYISEALDMAIQALSQEPCNDTVSREVILSKIKEVCFSKKWTQFRVNNGSNGQRDYLINFIEKLPPVTQKSVKCKDCKWWKDSDGVYRRGVGAESKCPINNVSVNHGLGYCYMFEPQERNKKE